MADTIRLNPTVAELPPSYAGMTITVACSKSGLTNIAALASKENPYAGSRKVTVGPPGENHRFLDALHLLTDKLSGAKVAS